MSNAQLSDLLTAKEMALFARDGFLHCESIVPQELNDAVYDDECHLEQQGYEFWSASEAIQKAFDLPRVKGIIQSLVGKDAVYDHSFLHTVPPGKTQSQNWHVDSGVMNPTPHQLFDIQAFYFAHDTPLEMGPTIVLPGSHLRRASYWSVSRYKNFAGQRHLVAKAGTIAFTHQDIWHCAQPNKTDKMRYVFKIRLAPRVEQRNLFNTEGYDEPEIMNILMQKYDWYGTDWQKDYYQKVDFWRYLVGNDKIQVR